MRYVSIVLNDRQKRAFEKLELDKTLQFGINTNCCETGASVLIFAEEDMDWFLRKIAEQEPTLIKRVHYEEWDGIVYCEMRAEPGCHMVVAGSPQNFVNLFLGMEHVTIQEA